MTFFLFCMDSAPFLMLNQQQICSFGRIQTSRTGGPPSTDTTPYGECSLGHLGIVGIAVASNTRGPVVDKFYNEHTYG